MEIFPKNYKVVGVWIQFPNLFNRIFDKMLQEIFKPNKYFKLMELKLILIIINLILKFIAWNSFEENSIWKFIEKKPIVKKFIKQTFFLIKKNKNKCF